MTNTYRLGLAVRRDLLRLALLGGYGSLAGAAAVAGAAMRPQQVAFPALAWAVLAYAGAVAVPALLVAGIGYVRYRRYLHPRWRAEYRTVRNLNAILDRGPGPYPRRPARH